MPELYARLEGGAWYKYNGGNWVKFSGNVPTQMFPLYYQPSTNNYIVYTDLTYIPTRFRRIWFNI